jgi:hypothetical protein
MLRWFENAARRIAVGYLPEVDDTLSAESLTTLKRNFGLADWHGLARKVVFTTN